jgi:Uma2 family endonuclease
MALTRQVEQSLYGQLIALPENLVGEIIDGQLDTHPRPSGPHAVAQTGLGADLIGPFQRGRGGPGGWWIIHEPEVHFSVDTEVLVPDVGGWRRQRMVRPPQDHRFTIPPDWVCEIISPSTAKTDRIQKPPIYCRYGVTWMWILDPLARTLEVFTLQNGQWVVTGLYRDADDVKAEPFGEITLHLADLWIEESSSDTSILSIAGSTSQGKC